MRTWRGAAWDERDVSHLWQFGQLGPQRPEAAQDAQLGREPPVRRRSPPPPGAPPGPRADRRQFTGSEEALPVWGGGDAAPNAIAESMALGDHAAHKADFAALGDHFAQRPLAGLACKLANECPAACSSPASQRAVAAAASCRVRTYRRRRASGFAELSLGNILLALIERWVAHHGIVSEGECGRGTTHRATDWLTDTGERSLSLCLSLPVSLSTHRTPSSSGKPAKTTVGGTTTTRIRPSSPLRTAFSLANWADRASTSAPSPPLLPPPPPEAGTVRACELPRAGAVASRPASPT